MSETKSKGKPTDRSSAGSDYRRVTVILNDLVRIEKDINRDLALTGRGNEKLAEEMKTFDDFQKLKYALNVALSDLHKDTATLDELKRGAPEGSPEYVNVIKQMTQNAQALQKAVTLFKDASAQYEADRKALARGKLKSVDEKEMELRGRSSGAVESRVGYAVLAKFTRSQQELAHSFAQGAPVGCWRYPGCGRGASVSASQGRDNSEDASCANKGDQVAMVQTEKPAHPNRTQTARTKTLKTSRLHHRKPSNNLCSSTLRMWPSKTKYSMN